MDRKAVSKILRQDVLSTLRPGGFKNSQSLTAWRYRPRTIDIVQLHFVHKWTAEDSHEFLDCSYTLGWGIYLTDVVERHLPRLDPQARLRPRLDEAHVYRVARRACADASGRFGEIFPITSAPSSIVACVDETLQILRTQLTQWFECYSSIASIISALQRTDAEQRSIDPYTLGSGGAESYTRKRVLANLLLAEGRFEEAAREIDRAYSTVVNRVDLPNRFVDRKTRDVHELELIEVRLRSARSLTRNSPA